MLKFVHSDASIGILMTVPRRSLFKPPNEFYQDRWDNQFRKYKQLIDADFDKFLSFYSCEEAVRFKLKKSGEVLEDEEAFEYVKNKETEVNMDKPVQLEY